MIRQAVPADLKQVIAIAKEAFVGEDAFGATWLVNKLAQPGTTLYVEDAALLWIRGFMLLEQHQLGTVVRLIAVAADARKQGIGAALLAFVKSPAYAWIREENTASQSLFKSKGFVEMEPPKRRKGEWRYFYLSGVSNEIVRAQ